MHLNKHFTDIRNIELIILKKFIILEEIKIYYYFS